MLDCAEGRARFLRRSKLRLRDEAIADDTGHGGEDEVESVIKREGRVMVDLAIYLAIGVGVLVAIFGIALIGAGR